MALIFNPLCSDKNLYVGSNVMKTILMLAQFPMVKKCPYVDSFCHLKKNLANIIDIHKTELLNLINKTSI